MSLAENLRSVDVRAPRDNLWLISVLTTSEIATANFLSLK